MDLIYTDPNKEDVGVLHDYEFDLAFGKDENDFECQVQASAHCCEPGAFLYIEGTEYGGIIDGIRSNTENGEVTYFGRTWHGILAGTIIKPEPGYDYYVVSGDANEVLAQLIDYLGLNNVFKASEEASDVQIGNFAFRYTDSYSGIRKMLAEFNGKLKLKFVKDIVVLSAVYLSDYSKDEEFDVSQVDFDVKKNFRPLNHLICLGSGNLKDRHVIHLFADENGGIKPYKKVDNPVSDDDYILDTSAQVLKGVDEVADIYDYPNAQTAENYIPLTVQPSDWASDYGRYFKRNSETKAFENVQGTPDVLVALLTEQPEDWTDSYANYYTLDGDNYMAVEGATNEKYKALTEKPVDWEKNYNNYFYDAALGILADYRKVEARSYSSWEALTEKPADWYANIDQYYKLSRKGGMVSAASGTGESPAWEEGKYYTRTRTTIPPEWSSTVDYYERISNGAPTWIANTYFTQTSATKAPEWSDTIPCYEKTKEGEYVKLTAKPDDWEENYGSYYYTYSDGVTEKYKKVQGVTEKTYQIQTQKPSDWESNYSHYYEVNSDGEYTKVKEVYSYTKLTSKPSAWEENYSNYYTFYSDGVTEEYRQLKGVSEDAYQLQTQEPSDWELNYDDYYERNGDGSYSKASGPVIDPAWEPDRFFRKKENTAAPQWKEGKYFELIKETVPPEWVADTYYSKEDITIKPSFAANVYFEKKLDNYADLVAGGVERMQEAYNCDSIAIDLDTEGEYDIGDIVGATEHVVGLSVWQPITKKIVNIKNGKTTISYKVGD